MTNPLRSRFGLCMTAFLVSLLLLTAGSATEPGALLEPERVEDLEATLLVQSLSSKDGEISGAEVVWLPESVRALCFGKSPKECEQLEHERRIEHSVDAEGRPRIGLRPWDGKPPSRLLSEWIVESQRYGSEGSTLLKQLISNAAVAQWFAALPRKGSVSDTVKVLSEDMLIGARVRWELWPNGENFKVLALRDAP